MASDVTAVVLSIGESFTQRAIDSLTRQTSPPVEIIEVTNIVPFSRALNQGSRRVRTPFFVQVDSDMVLDDNCLEELRRCTEENVGVTVGPLRDPLVGREAGVKVFRTKCFETLEFNDSLSPDTEFCRDLIHQGWNIKYVLNQKHSDPRLWPAFGDHRPDYTPLYTYWRFRLLGTRYKYRPDLPAFEWRYWKMRRSDHRFATLARISFLQGLFYEARTDLLRPFVKNDASESLLEFIRTTGDDRREHDFESILRAGPRRVFKEFLCRGAEYKRYECYRGFERCLAALDDYNGESAWIARAALCQGIFPSECDQMCQASALKSLTLFFRS